MRHADFEIIKSRAEDDKASENKGNNEDSSGTSSNGAVAAVNDGMAKTIGVEKSPFEVEGEA